MKILIGGGTGFIGRFLINHYLKAGYEITVVGRSTSKITHLFQNNVIALDWDTLHDLGPDAVAGIDHIINLAGAGIAQKRWTAERKQVLIESRTKTTALLANLCAGLGKNSPALFIAGGVGIYGQQTPTEAGLPPALDESCYLDPNNPPDFLSKIGRRWEAAAKPAVENHVRVVNLRFGVVLGPSGGALQQMKLPFQFYLGGKIGSGKQPFSWVSMLDLWCAIDFLQKKHDISGPVNIVSPHCLTQYEFAKHLGKVMHKPSIMPTPAFALRLLLGEMADELLLNGQHVTPQVLLSNGYTFKHPDIDSALSYAL